MYVQYLLQHTHATILPCTLCNIEGDQVQAYNLQLAQAHTAWLGQAHKVEQHAYTPMRTMLLRALARQLQQGCNCNGYLRGTTIVSIQTYATHQRCTASLEP